MYRSWYNKNQTQTIIAIISHLTYLLSKDSSKNCTIEDCLLSVLLWLLNWVASLKLSFVLLILLIINEKRNKIWPEPAETVVLVTYYTVKLVFARALTQNPKYGNRTITQKQNMKKLGFTTVIAANYPTKFDRLPTKVI